MIDLRKKHWNVKPISSSWRKWFAWYPIWVVANMDKNDSTGYNWETKWVWFCWVERRLFERDIYLRGLGHCVKSWLYRIIDNEESILATTVINKQGETI